MPALSFLAFVGLALIALLFYGNATLEPISPEMVATPSCRRTSTSTQHDLASCASAKVGT